MLNLCSTWKALYALQIQHLFLLSYLNYKIMSISSQCSSPQSSTQLTIHPCMHINTLNLFLLHLQLKSIHILTKSLPEIRQNLTNPWKVYTHFIQILSIVLAIFAYYAVIILNAVVFILCSKLYWHSRLKPIHDVHMQLRYIMYMMSLLSS